MRTYRAAVLVALLPGLLPAQTNPISKPFWLSPPGDGILESNKGSGASKRPSNNGGTAEGPSDNVVSAMGADRVTLTDRRQQQDESAVNHASIREQLNMLADYLTRLGVKAEGLSQIEAQMGSLKEQDRQLAVRIRDFASLYLSA